MDYEKKYKALVEAVKTLKETNPSDEGIQNWVNDNVPELKDRVQPKQEWSEEDEKIIIQIRDAVEDYFPTPVADKIKNWLNSLEPQNK